MSEEPTEAATAEESEPEQRVVTEGFFEEEYYVSAADAGEFLIELGEQLIEEDELTVSGDDWELPFAFGEPVNLDIEYEGDSEPELEIEVELPGRVENETPDLS